MRKVLRYMLLTNIPCRKAETGMVLLHRTQMRESNAMNPRCAVPNYPVEAVFEM